jgi:hypothetical protein
VPHPASDPTARSGERSDSNVPRRPARPGRFARLARASAWGAIGLLVKGWRLVSAATGGVRTADTVIYKADRLGDWLLAEPTIERIVDSVRKRGGTVVVWAAREGSALREWRRPAFEVEAFALEPRGVVAKARGALAVARLLASYRCRAFVSLRYSPEPVRDFVLAHVAASDRYALSWLIYDGPAAAVPHEIIRHAAILDALGLTADPGALLPRFAEWGGGASRGVVLTPFSSAAIKDWSDEGWREIISRLEERGYLVEIWIAPDQREHARSLVTGRPKESPGPRATIRTGTIGELAQAVGTACLVLTVDTVTAHLATAIDVPMVCLLGGGQYGDFGPWRNSARQRWITQRLPCFGCDWHCSRPSVECLLTIPASRVESEVEAALAASTGNAPRPA